MTSETNDANSKPLNLKPHKNPGVKATEPSPSEKFQFAKRFLVGVGIFCVVALICSTVFRVQADRKQRMPLLNNPREQKYTYN